MYNPPGTRHPLMFLRYLQACKLKFILRKLTLCLYSSAVLAVRFEGRVAGLDATEKGNEISQPKFDIKSLDSS